MSNNKEHYHNKGEQDRSEGNGYNPPHGIIDDLTTWSSDGMEKNADENSAYKDGYTNTDSQLKNK
jgi:hypothetical protein